MPKFEVKVERDITEKHTKFIFADTLDDANEIAEEQFDSNQDWHDRVEWERTDVSYSCALVERVMGRYTTFMITEHQEARFDLDVMVGGTDYTCFAEKSGTVLGNEDGSFFIDKTNDEQIDRDYEVEPNRYYFLTYADAQKVALAFIAEELFVKKIYEDGAW